MRLAHAAQRLSVVASAVALTAGCGITHVQDLSFRVDHRLHFVGLKDRADTHLPVTIRWRMSDFAIAAPGSAPASRHAGYFALFVDQSPIRPGQTMKAICKADPFERGDAACPTTSYLQGKLIYPTTNTAVSIDSLPNVAGNKDNKQLHTFIVVLMDTSGRRLGESAWEIDLRLPRIGA